VRLAAEAAVRKLGFEPGLAPARIVFVDLAGLGACPCAQGDGRGLIIGYVTGRPLTAAAHAAHGCCTQVMELVALRDGPAFRVLAVPPALEAARLTTREADVLALVLAGASDRRIAAALGIAPSCARPASAAAASCGVATGGTWRAPPSSGRFPSRRPPSGRSPRRHSPSRRSRRRRRQVCALPTPRFVELRPLVRPASLSDNERCRCGAAGERVANADRGGRPCMPRSTS